MRIQSIVAVLQDPLQSQHVYVPYAYPPYASPYCVCYVAAAAFGVLAGVDNLNLQIWVFIQNLLDPAVVATLSRLHLALFVMLLLSSFFLIQRLVVHVVWSRGEVGGVMLRGG